MVTTSILGAVVFTQHLLLSVFVLAGQMDDERRLQAVCQDLRGRGLVAPLAYPANLAVLMDSWNYQNLLPPRTGAVWQQVDNDSNNVIGLTTNWIQNSNTPCQQNVHVCGFSAGMQNNWLITQLINRTVDGARLPQVSVLIEFEMQGCDVNLKCQRTFNTYVYEAEPSIGNDSATMVENYRQVERVSPDVTSGVRVNETVDLNFSTNSSSFYFAIQDETSCIIVTRLIIFYNVCPMETEDLVVRPQTIAPLVSRQAVPRLVTAECVDHASPMVDGALGPTLKCNEGGRWSAIPGLGCKCDLGYVPSKDRLRCEACPDGQYYSSYSGVCVDCPANSTSLRDNSTTNTSLLMDACECVEGYFRPRGEATNGTCVPIMKDEEKPKRSSSLSIIIPVILVLCGSTVVLVTGLYVCKLYRKRRRMYQINGFAPWQNGSDENHLGNGRHDSMPQRRNGVCRNSNASRSTRPSSTSIKMNVTSFLFKVIGSPSSSALVNQHVPEPTATSTSSEFEAEEKQVNQLEKVLYYDTEDESLFHVNELTSAEEDEKKLDDFDESGYVTMV